MSNETITIFLLGVATVLIINMSQLQEKVERIDRKLDKIAKYLRIEVDENIDDELKEII